jgi:hypothetical protein
MKILEKSLEEKNFDECRKFDSIFKHKEYDIFKPKFIEIK